MLMHVWHFMNVTSFSLIFKCIICFILLVNSHEHSVISRNTLDRQTINFLLKIILIIDYSCEILSV